MYYKTRLHLYFCNIPAILKIKAYVLYRDNSSKQELLDNIRFREALELFPKYRDNGRETST